MTAGALSGVRIADFTQLYQGPLATQILGDLGAVVVKIEPLKGDFMRHWSLGDHFPAGESMSFLSVNRNKRSIAIDLKTQNGLQIARRLIATSDVLVENFRPEVMDRLGLGYESLREAHARLIYCASSGFGQTGPYRDRPGQDLLIQALGGTMWLNGRRTDPPTAVGFGIADSVAGMQIVQGILAALFERERSGRGQRVDINLLSSLLVLQNQELTFYANTRREPHRPVANTTAVYAGAPLGVYRTADGYVAVAMMGIGRLADLVGVEELHGIESTNDVARRDEIHGLLEKGFLKRTRDEWMDLLRRADVWAAPVQVFGEVVADPQITWNKSVLTIDHPTVGVLKAIASGLTLDRTPALVLRPPPRLGEQTREVLTELGFAADDVERFVADRAVLECEPPPESAVP